MMTKASIKQKILTLVVCQTLLVVGVGAVAYFSLHAMGRSIHWIARVTAPNLIHVGLMNTAESDIFQHLEAMALYYPIESEVEKAHALLDQAINTYKTEDREYNATPFVEREEKLYKSKVQAHWGDFEVRVQAVAKALSSPSRSEHERGLSLLGQLKPYTKAIDDGLDELLNFQKKDAAERATASESSAERSLLVTLVVVLFGSIVSLVSGWMVSSNLVKALSELAVQLSKGAETVATTSVQVSAAGASLASAVTQQASAIQETVSAVDEISATVSRNAEGATQSSDEARASEQSALEGKESMQEMLNAIERIAAGNRAFISQTTEGNQQLQKIVEIIREIEGKTKVINDIVFQTKLLSFNASVEAARAGEHGKGFAVVAEEVGNLAQMSGNAAREIKALLDRSVREVEDIVNRTKGKSDELAHSAREQINEGTRIANDCEKILLKLVERSTIVAQAVNQIAVASSEQSKGIQEISQAMAELDRATQTNAAASGETSAAAQSMSAQAQQLKDLSQRLVEVVEGSSSSNYAQSSSLDFHDHKDPLTRAAA